MLISDGNTWMASMPDWRSIFQGLGRYRCQLLLVCIALLTLSTQASAGTIRQYFVHEPVFHGRIRVLEAGQREAPAIILVHGLNASADVWRRFIPALAKKLHVVALDLPGFGQSEKGNKLYSPDNYVAVIHYLADRLQLQHFILVGHSLGGNIALRYAQTYPGQVRRLVLIDAAGVLHRLVYTEFLVHFGIRLLPAFYPQQRGDLTSLTNSLFNTLTDYSPALDVGEHYMLSQPDLREEFLDGAPPAIAAYAMALTNFNGVLDHFSVPTLLLWGGQDHIAPLRTAHLLAANFINAGLIVFPGIGHSPLHEDPQEVEHWLVRFSEANAANRDRLLAAHRYKLSYSSPNHSHRIGRCQHAAHQTFSGDYQRLEIDHCQDIRLQDLRARHIVIRHSQVVLVNCRLRGEGAVLNVIDSSVQMTACHVHGKPALLARGSKLDIAGSHLSSPSEAIQAGNADSVNTVLFSVSELESYGQRRFEHGPVQLKPGQQL